jgi:hypothetical protein
LLKQITNVVTQYVIVGAGLYTFTRRHLVLESNTWIAEGYQKTFKMSGMKRICRSLNYAAPENIIRDGSFWRKEDSKTSKNQCPFAKASLIWNVTT